MERPLGAEAVASICAHMNDDHADAVAEYARTYAGIEQVVVARLASLDAEGMDLDVETPTGAVRARVPFEHALRGADDARQTLIAMARASR